MNIVANIKNKIINKKEKKTNLLNIENDDWYADRYRSVVFYRNIMLAIATIAIVGMCISMMVALQISVSKKLEPFVIEVEKKTGVVTLVDQSSPIKYTADEAVNNYFLVKYLSAREIYDKNTYVYDWYTVVKELSAGDVYRYFMNLVSNTDDKTNPMNLYAEAKNLDIKIRSIQYLTAKSAQIRFSLFDNDGRVNRLMGNRVALISFDYMSDILLQMTTEQRYTNPLGFKVISYRVNDEML